jgi:hypothetical protein
VIVRGISDGNTYVITEITILKKGNQIMKEQTICAKVNPRLLTKADRLFTGTLEGRIIELLQNARRAGATEVHITNKQNLVIIEDNGCGITDFQKLLDLGGSGWDEKLEACEDPAGVGIFSLAPRQVTIESGMLKLVITDKIWQGQPARLFEAHDEIKGTRFQFSDEPWTQEVVGKYAVFTSLDVTVDKKSCSRKLFCSRQAVHYPELGCRIEIRNRDNVSQWHKAFRTNYFHQEGLVNFHGQVVSFDYEPLRAEHLAFLVDLTGEPTGLRLMLPARTRMVENEAFEQLKEILEKEAYHHIQRQESHKLPYDQYLRAKELGIDLPEAEPVFDVGLLSGDTPEPIGIVKPKEFPLSKCYLMKDKAEELDNKNAHILAALGKFNIPFVPVNISPLYQSYSWAKLPTIEKVKVSVGKRLGTGSVWGGDMDAYDFLEITVLTSDGKRFQSTVSMAVRERKRTNSSYWIENTVCLTPEAKKELSSSDIWFFLGGWNEDGDTYDTQIYQFEDEMEHFWADILGPEAFMRDKLLGTISSFISKWKKITLDENGAMTIVYHNGTEKNCQAI